MLIHISRLITHSHGLARSSGLGTGGLHPPAHILVQFPVTHSPGDRVPRSTAASQCLSPLPQEPWLGLPAGMSAVPEPKMLLELQNGEDMEIETGGAASRARGLPGQLWRDSPARGSTLFTASLGETYTVRKRTSSHHKTQQPCFFVAHQGTTKLAQGGCHACMSATRFFFPSASQDVGCRDTAFHVAPGRQVPQGTGGSSPGPPSPATQRARGIPRASAQGRD